MLLVAPRRTRLLPSDVRLHHNQAGPRIEVLEIFSIARDDGLAMAACADHHVRIGDVRGLARREEHADLCCIVAIEGHDLCGRLPDEPRQPGLLRWLADRL